MCLNTVTWGHAAPERVGKLQVNKEGYAPFKVIPSLFKPWFPALHLLVSNTSQLYALFKK